MTHRPDPDYAAALDAADPLASFRRQFHLPPTQSGEPSIYFCGHSLGLQPRTAEERVQAELARWRELAVEAHFHGPNPWLSFHELLTPGLAYLAGALPTEVVAMNSLTVNLHLLSIGFYRPSAARNKILIERSAFPSDRYAMQSQLALHGSDPAATLLEVAPRAEEHLLRTEDLIALLEREGSSIATVMLPGVQYLNGQCLDMQAITAAAHAQGCIVGFDLAHAMGNVPLQLHDWNVDFAVWCSYKYLNAGPGAIGGAFVHERHARRFDLPRLAGWWGHDKSTRFQMPQAFQPLAGAEGWQLSNPPILACAPLLASLEIFQAAGMPSLREKSLRLNDYFDYLLRMRVGNRVQTITPAESSARGCQLSLRLAGGRAQARGAYEQLGKQGVVCDWREPDVIRVAPTPLYNTFSDIWRCCDLLAKALP